MAEIWIHHNSFIDNDDYSVADWAAAEKEVVFLMRNALGYCPESIGKQIEKMITKGNWKEAVSLFNEENYGNEQILMREGKQVYK